MKVHAKAKELVEIGRTLGFTPDEHHDGQGHIVLRHRKGQVIIPATPSEYRGRKNAISQMERVSGRKLARPNHRKSHKGKLGTDFTVETARRENVHWHKAWGGEVDDLRAERDAAIHEFQRLRDEGTRCAVAKVVPVIRRIEQVERKLAAMHQPFDPFDPLTD